MDTKSEWHETIMFMLAVEDHWRRDFKLVDFPNCFCRMERKYCNLYLLSIICIYIYASYNKGWKDIPYNKCVKRGSVINMEGWSTENWMKHRAVRVCITCQGEKYPIELDTVPYFERVSVLNGPSCIWERVIPVSCYVVWTCSSFS